MNHMVWSMWYEACHVKNCLEDISGSLKIIIEIMIHIIILLMTSSLSWNWNSNENFKVENFINLELILHIIVTSQNSNDNGWPRIPSKFKIFENILDMKKCPTQSVGGTKFVLRFNFWIFITENSTFYRNVRNVPIPVFNLATFDIVRETLINKLTVLIFSLNFDLTLF